MKTIEGLEKQLADALARERQLREAITAFSEMYPRMAASFQQLGDALSTPAPRVFTVEECKPLVEALHWMELTDAAHSNAARAECKLCRALEHAHKLGMEGA